MREEKDNKRKEDKQEQRETRTTGANKTGEDMRTRVPWQRRGCQRRVFLEM